MKQIAVIILLAINFPVILTDYWKERQHLINSDKSNEIGRKLPLTARESQANEVLLKFKWKEYDKGLKNSRTFLPNKLFVEVKEKIDRSNVFKIIKILPKGASLHSHISALVSRDFLYNLTFRNNLYGCINGPEFTLHFFSINNISNDCNWTLLSDLRKNSNFEEFLKSELTLIHKDSKTSTECIWNDFEKRFTTIKKLIHYKPVFAEYFYQVLKESYEDNVKYLEFRSSLSKLYDLNGNQYMNGDILEIFISTLKIFQNDYPDFSGAKLIYSAARVSKKPWIKYQVQNYKKLKTAYPEFLVGFDLVGHEDEGYPLTHFLTELLELKQFGAKFFFHAGETQWNGGHSDLNLFDAILLNATRIGHGYTLIKHPLAAKIIKDRNIAIEVCPISNQALNLISDLTNHPAAYMIANGFPIVIGSDDPSFWGAKGLSYDWYMAFMAMTSRDTDIRFLKQIALNSIEYSSMDEHQKILALSQWQQDWDVFIEKIINKDF